MATATENAAASHVGSAQPGQIKSRDTEERIQVPTDDPTKPRHADLVDGIDEMNINQGNASASADAHGAANADNAQENGAPQPPFADQGPGQGQDDGQNPHPNGHKFIHEGPHHHSGDIKQAYQSQKQKLKDMTKPPGGFDPTPLPDAPPGYTLKFIFHRASNLPAADLAGASDPFIHATLKAPVLKRHKEDPDLTHRTRTIRKTTEPVWDDEWIVANVPTSGFTLKCRIYDEDYPDSDDRLGNVTLDVGQFAPNWEGIPVPGKEFPVKKRMGSKRAYLGKTLSSGFGHKTDITPSLWLSVQVLGQSPPPHAQMYTAGPSFYFKHFSPTIGRITGTKVNKNAEQDYQSGKPEQDEDGKDPQRYDFQSNEIQLAGPVPPILYHRYVEFRQTIGRMFTDTGLRGRILNKALHKQHRRVYNFSPSTEHATFEPRSEEASMNFLRMAHYSQGGRVFTYVLTLDGMFRFTETGSEFSIDLLSKHTMHSDVAYYIAFSGEFFIRRLQKPVTSSDTPPSDTQEVDNSADGTEQPLPDNPAYYQLIIDNDSGTYRPDKSVLPYLRDFMAQNFPGLGVIAAHCEDEDLIKLKAKQFEVKKQQGKRMNIVLNRSPSGSSLSSMSSAESDLDHVEAAAASAGTGQGASKTKREKALELVENPKRVKDYLKYEKRVHLGEGSHGGSEKT